MLSSLIHVWTILAISLLAPLQWRFSYLTICWSWLKRCRWWMIQGKFQLRISQPGLYSLRLSSFTPRSFRQNSFPPIPAYLFFPIRPSIRTYTQIPPPLLTTRNYLCFILKFIEIWESFLSPMAKAYAITEWSQRPCAKDCVISFYHKN
jgi:hypothetical protein